MQAFDEKFRELMLHDAQQSLHNDLEQLIQTAPDAEKVDCLVCYLLCIFKSNMSLSKNVLLAVI